jgi:hypothetical protein
VSVFTPESVWSGGYYEVVLVLGGRSDTRLAAAIKRLWEHPRLEGPYGSSSREPSDQSVGQPDVEVTDRGALRWSTSG